ncbi:hypothetical protein KX935_05180 [Streptobacillus moniliformis]|nr:hypothetical protein KX935_05180 [Streptobacillus moniliformis]
MTLIYYTIQAIIIALILSLVIIIVGLIIKSKIKKDKNISDLKLKKIKKLIISNESLLEDVPEGGLNKKIHFLILKKHLKRLIKQKQ